VRAQLAAHQKQLDEQRQTVEALQAQADAAAEALGGDAIEEPTFRVYGFIDMGLQKLWSKTDDPTTPTQKTTFVLGNINLYFDFRPTSRGARWSRCGSPAIRAAARARASRRLAFRTSGPTRSCSIPGTGRATTRSTGARSSSSAPTSSGTSWTGSGCASGSS
jgi:hypothetical protein